MSSTAPFATICVQMEYNNPNSEWNPRSRPWPLSPDLERRAGAGKSNTRYRGRLCHGFVQLDIFSVVSTRLFFIPMWIGGEIFCRVPEYHLVAGINFMVVLGAYAPGSCDFAPRCWSIGAEFVNGHIYHHFEHFESFSLNFNFFYLLILPKSAKKCIWKHIFFKFFWGSMLQYHLTWTVCLWQNLRCVVLVQGFICS